MPKYAQRNGLLTHWLDCVPIIFQYNPFRNQIFAVFSSQNDGRLSFEDFVDLSSVMSVNCPLRVKAAWAFRVFGAYTFDAHGPRCM